MKPTLRAGIAAALATVLAGSGLAVSTLTAHASTEPVAAPLPAPAVLSPDDTGVSPVPVRKTVTLDWAPVPGATGYRVQVGTDSTWSDTPVFTDDVVFSEDTLPLWVPDATYVWRVAALTGTTVGHWSSEAGQAQTEATFTKGWRTVPTLTQIGSSVGTPVFRWSPVPGASGYEVQVSAVPFVEGTSTSSPGTSPSPGTVTQAPPQPAGLMADCYTPRTQYTPAQDVVGKGDSVGPCTFNTPASGSTVYWRVRALDAYVGSGQTVSTTPVVSEGVSYSGYKTTSSTPDLSSGCPTTPASASPSPSPTASSGGPVTATCGPSRPSDVAIWSPQSSFVFSQGTGPGVAGPQVPTASLANEPDGLCAVTNAGSGQPEHARCADMPTLSWAGVPGDPVYRVIIALDDAFANIQYETEVNGLTWTPAGSWRDGTYYYAVQACTSTACGPVTTTPPSFTKVTPRLALGTAPGVRGEFHLSWQSYAAALRGVTGKAETQDAFAYHVQVASADHPSYDSVVDDELVDGTSLSPHKSYGDGWFVWRVQAVDSKGDLLPWSYSQSFFRDSTPPYVASVSPSSNVSVLQPLRVVFSEPVVGVSASTLRLSPSAAATVTSAGDGVTFTLRPSTPLRPGATYRVTVTSAVTDLSGNVAVPLGPAVTVSSFVDDPSRAIGYGGYWRTLASSNAMGRTFHGSVPTPTSQTRARVPFAGTGLYLSACRTPSSGYLDVYVDGVRRTRVNLYRSYSGCGVRVAAVTGLSRGNHTLLLVGIGKHASPSKGNAVTVDAVRFLP